MSCAPFGFDQCRWTATTPSWSSLSSSKEMQGTAVPVSLTQGEMGKVVAEFTVSRGLFWNKYPVLQPWREMRRAAVSLLPGADDTHILWLLSMEWAFHPFISRQPFLDPAVVVQCCPKHLLSVWAGSEPPPSILPHSPAGFLGKMYPPYCQLPLKFLQHLAADQMEFNSSLPASGHQICCHPFQCRHYLACSVSI